MTQKPISRWHRSMLLLVCALMLSQQGCFQHRERYNLASFWMDYNTLCAPAIFFEKQSHFPYQAKQVSYLHWQYGVTPGRNVKYSRPDLTGGNLGTEAAMYEGVMNVNGINGSLQPVMEPLPAVNENPTTNSKPSVNANGSMSVAPPQVKLKPREGMKKPSLNQIPPPPAPATP
tara:strand:- start:91460 stop:91981 length:522 start_codon:yes stop_codon:yes gene_type:complete